MTGGGKPRYSGKSEIFKELKELMRGLGIERDNLPPAIGQHLRRAWGIHPGLGADDCRTILKREIELILDQIEDPKLELALRIGFNIAAQQYLHDEIRKLSFIKRVRWLGNPKIDWRHVPDSDEKKFLRASVMSERNIRTRIDNALEHILSPAIGERLATLDTTRPHEAPVRVRSPRLAGRRPLVASASALVLIAALAIIIPNLSGAAAPASHPSNSTAPSATSAAALTATEPVLIEQVGELDTGPNNSFVTSGKPQLPASQLAQMDSNSLANLRTLYSAIPTKSGSISVTMMGNASETVTITGMRVIKQCGAPVTGALFYSSSAGEDTTISLGFDLDSQITYAQDTEAGRSYMGDFFQEHVVRLAPKETQTFAVYVTTTRHYCTFSFELAIATAHGSVTEQIPPRGKPFALTALDPGLSHMPGQQDFSAYQAVYITGQAAVPEVPGFVSVNPKTYKGSGNPKSYPPV